ncbi:neural cell adhesion molecule 2-like, partial [Saccoglossus kowalevskii]|uniref:Fasciclin-2-like n=1 Tax=Saccoglossus kowalevskii TaxID=10224 RepID=A0ABM0MSF0_SACKO
PEKTALTIIDLSEFDEGLYTCMASNDAGQVEAVAKLSIHLLPVVGETEDLTVEEGGDIMFTCTAVKGSPVPALKWRRNNVDLYFGATLEDPRMEIYKDGESLILYIKDIKSTDNGAYTCIAENFAGTDAKNFHLFVEHAPHFDSELTQTVVKSWEENPTELSCVAIGNPTPMMSWQHNGMNLDNTTLVDLGLGRVQSLLSVLPSKDDFGDYMCYADNSHGSVNVTITLEETYAPLPPSKIIIDFTTPTSVGFSIKDPEMDGGWPIESCQAILSNSRGEVVKEFETDLSTGKTQSRSLAQAKTRSRSLAQAKTQSRSLAQAKTQSRSLAQAKTRSRSLAQAKTRSRSLAQAKTQSRSLAQAKTRSRSLAQAKTQSRSLAQAKTQSRSLAQAKTRSRSLAQAKTQSRSLAQANTHPGP